MDFKETFIKGLFEIYPKVFKDQRGFFLESFNQKEFDSHIQTDPFVQDNQSFSTKGVLRGLHFQDEPFAQGKLVSVIKGKVLDVAVDIRKGSETFGQYFSCILDDLQHNMLFVPKGFAHGFLALEDSTFFYKCTNFYHKPAENGILWNDPVLNIQWNFSDPVISDKDQELPSFASYRNQNQ
ncbi:MAG: dTDP-4-dehydrorhamnose 3,5-epimerase [Candidatus Cyclobacteriaceae bacterium M3_2C_046]